jgi:hypothetical protein
MKKKSFELDLRCIGFFHPIQMDHIASCLLIIRTMKPLKYIFFLTNHIPGTQHTTRANVMKRWYQMSWYLRTQKTVLNLIILYHSQTTFLKQACGIPFLSVCPLLPLLGNGVSFYMRGGIGLPAQALWLSRAADLLPLRRRMHIVCFEHVPNTTFGLEVLVSNPFWGPRPDFCYVRFGVPSLTIPKERGQSRSRKREHWLLTPKHRRDAHS